MIRNVLTALSILLLLAACSSGKKAYERGDYYGSVMKSIGRLRQNPDHSKSKETLRNAYPLAVSFLEQQANNELASNSNQKWKNVLNYYGQINSMYEAIRQAPGALSVVSNPKNYYNELGPIKEKAAEESYNAGITALMKGTRHDARAAFYLFTDVNSYVPGYKDVLEYTTKAKDEATLRVVLEQIPVPARYNLSGGFFQDKVEEYVRTNYPDRGFIKFYTPQELNAIKLDRVDQILKIAFDDFQVGNTKLSEKEETVSKDSVKVGETTVAGKKYPVYNTVKAKLITYRKEVTSNGLLSMQVLDAKTGGVLTHKKFSGDYVWVSSWARFNGDERALTDQQLKLCNSKETQPPVNQDLFLEFTKPIYNQLIPGIRGFYEAFQ